MNATATTTRSSQISESGRSVVLGGRRFTRAQILSYVRREIEEATGLDAYYPSAPITDAQIAEGLAELSPARLVADRIARVEYGARDFKFEHDSSSAYCNRHERYESNPTHTVLALTPAYGSGWNVLGRFVVSTDCGDREALAEFMATGDHLA